MVDKVHWGGVVLPLEEIVPRKPGLWRFAMAVPDETLTNEEVGDPKYVHELLLKYLYGPRPAECNLVRRRANRLTAPALGKYHASKQSSSRW